MRGIKTGGICLPVVFVVAALLVPAAAGALEGSPFRIGVETEGEYRSEADVEEGPGAYSVSGAGAALVLGYKSNEFKLSYGLESYDWSNKADLPFGAGGDDPWTELYTLGLTGRRFGTISGKWSYFVGGGLSWMYEDQMDSPGARLYGGVGYAFTDRLRVSLGAAVQYHEVRTRVLPLAGLVYAPAGEAPGGPPAQGLRVALGFPESSVTYRFNPMLALRLAGTFDAGVYRLADDSNVAPEGYVEKWGYGGGLFLDVSPTRRFTVSVGGQYLFGRELTLYDEDEDEIDSYDVDPAAAAVVKLEIMF